MKILVLGATGAMGTNLINILSKTDNYIYATSRKKINSENENVKFLQGNAHDLSFLNKITEKDFYDVIVDFMVYSVSEFEKVAEILLHKTNQYIFISSGRVFAESTSPIIETSDRLLDTTTDKEYLMLEEYALNKAKEENILKSYKNQNWTILRPYITYNFERLQLGFYEKENWLYRALKDKPIVFFEDIADTFTTMTNSYDVANCLFEIIGNEKALGQTFNATAGINNAVKWGEILKIYQNAIYKVTNKQIKVYMLKNAEKVSKFLHNEYQYKYDRLFNRIFDNEKVMTILPKDYNFIDVNKGLTDCIQEFLENNVEPKYVNYPLDGFLDRIVGEKVEISSINGFKNKIAYVSARYFPNILQIYFQLRRKLKWFLF